MKALILQATPRDLDPFRKALARLGFHVSGVSTPKETLEACSRGRVDLILLRWTKKTGVKRLVRGIRKVDPAGGPHPLIVAVVPKAGGEAAALEGGADVGLPASASPRLFAARLRAALGRIGPEGTAQSRALFESSRDAIMLLDEGGFFDCNRATLEIFGIPDKEEFLRTHPADLSPPKQPDGEDSRGAADRRITEAFQQGHLRFEWMHRRRNGEDFPADVWLMSFLLKDRTVLQATVRDLTERKAAEEALKESEDQYRSLVNNVNIGVYRNTAGKEGRFLRANPAIVQMFGYGSEEEFLRIKVADLYEDPEDRQRFVQEILAHGQVRNRELRLRRKDGSLFWGAVTARVARDGQGNILWLDGVIEDITERKRTEEALSESQRRFRAIIDQTFQFIGMTTTDGILIEVNETALAFSGVRREDVLNKPFWEGPWWTHSPELQARLRDAIRQAAAGQFIRFEVTHPARDGSLHTVDFSLKPIRNSEGRVTLLVPEGRDITGYKRAEEALQQSEQRMRLHVQHTPLAVIEWDTSFRVLRWNPGAEKIFGHTSAQATGQHASFILPERVRPLVDQVWGELLAKKGGERATNENLTRDGRTIVCDWYNTPLIGAEGKFVGVASLVQDVTERQRAEQALRESERRLTDILQFFPDPTLVLDREGRVTAWNRAMESLTGVKARDMIGKGNYEHALPFYGERRPVLIDLALRDDPEMKKNYVSIEQRGDILTGETWVPALSQGKTYLYAAAAVLRDGEGKVAGAIESIRDITERKRAEEALRQSEEKYRTLFDSAGDAIFIHDMAGRMLAANRGACRYYGYTHAEIMSLSPGDVDTPEQADHVAGRIAALKENGHIVFDTIHRRKDGSRLPTEVNAQIVTFNGEPAILAICRDITERKRAEEALRRERDFRRTLIEASPAYFVTLRGDGATMTMNEAMLKALGYRSEDVMGKDYLSTFVPERDRAALGEIFRQLTASRSPTFNVSRLLTASGKELLVEWHGRGIFKEDGELDYFIVIGNDITERQRLDEELRRSERKYRSVLENAPIGVFQATIEGRLIQVNPEGVRLTGHTGFPEMRRAIGDDIRNLFINSARYDEFVEHIHRTGETKDFEFEGRRGDGGEMWLSMHARRITDDDGKPLYLDGFFFDLSDRRRMEEALRGAKMLAEESARAKSEFLANMSHEIRTPLNGVMGMLGLALDGTLSDEQREYLDLARSSADSLLEIINDILDFSKIEAKKLEIEEVEFSLHDLCSETLPLAGFEADRKGLELVCEIDPAVPPALVGDPLRLKQTVLNLLKNAVKFTEKGHVLLQVKKEEEPATGRSILHFIVSDTGIGIPPEQQERIFESFTQADSGMTRKYGGTGLGLTISRNLVEMMDGTIWVESQAGRGSTFHFTIPLRHAGKVPAASPVPPPALKGSRVLVVDDHALNRTILRKYLESWGLIAEEAEDGPRCLGEIHRAKEGSRPYDIILLDCMMPGMSGLDVVERLKLEGEAGSSIIIMLTSMDEKGSRERCRQMGISQYLVKPVSPSTLFNAIIEVLGAPEDRGGERPEAPAPVRIPSFKPDLRILVAEDNPINAKLVLRLLERVGLKARIAENGLKATEAVGASDCDLILMDVQMPEMDGLAATRVIRERERTTGRHVPIIALTAHAIKGDRERFLASGMDDYLAKPLHADQLYRLIGKYAPSEGPAAPAGLPPPPPAPEGTSAPLLDATGLVSRLGGDEALAREALGMFLEEGPRTLGRIDAAARRGDARELREAAHYLKGMAANVSAGAIQEACREAELMAAASDLAGAAPALGRLEGLMRKTNDEIRKYLGK